MAEGVIVTALEKRLDKLIALTELQNKAWERSLQLLNGIHTIVVEKQLASDKLLQEHPTVMGPEPITVGKARQPQPFNDYTDSVPYGTELEEEREAEVRYGRDGLRQHRPGTIMVSRWQGGGIRQIPLR